MMYRPHSAQRSARLFANIAAIAIANAAASGVVGAAMALMDKLGILEQAERENRQFNRRAKRQRYHNAYSVNGMNGPRAMARRRRQIAAGSLRVENGLVT